MQDLCPVSASAAMRYVRDVPTRRTNRQVSLLNFNDCHSYWNSSGYVEDEEQLERDLGWGLSVQPRNLNAAERLFRKLREEGVEFNSVAGIGCGNGTLLTVARNQGKEVVGYDVSETAIRYATEVSKLPAKAERWTSETSTIPIDLYLCISVLERVAQPRALIEHLCKAAEREYAALFISVPFLDEDRRHFIADPDPYRPGTPFLDNDVHVTHLSTEGLMRAMRCFGRNNLQFIQAGLWNGVLARP